MLSMEICRENSWHIIILLSSYNDRKCWSVHEDIGFSDGYGTLICGGRIEEVKFSLPVEKNRYESIFIIFFLCYNVMIYLCHLEKY